MQLFKGLPGTDYQDVLRVLGHFLDERGFRNVRLVEHPDGLVIQATPTIDGRVSTRFETFLLTDHAIERLLALAYERRAVGGGTGALTTSPTGLTGLLPRRSLPAELAG